MDWKLRLQLGIVILFGALLIGAFGGFFGRFLPFWGWLLVIGIITPFLLPWKDLIWSQEALTQDLRSLDSALDELLKAHDDVKVLRAELEAAGSLKQKDLDQVVQRYIEIQRLPTEHERTLRELLFGAYRRTLALRVLMVAFAGFGGALLVYHFHRWMI